MKRQFQYQFQQADDDDDASLEYSLDEEDEEDYDDDDGDGDEEEEGEEDRDDDAGGAFEGRASRARVWAAPNPIQYTSLDDRPMTLLTSVSSSAAVEEGHPYFRTTLLPGQRDPFLSTVPTPPHLGLTPHGAPVSSTIYNLRKAVELGDTAHTAACLLALFDLFVATNRPIRAMMVPPTTDREVRLELLQRCGPFENRNALAMHQTLWNVLRTVFMEQIGVANCTALLELQQLWREYQLFLFCDPYKSLAALLSIGQLLCRCYKDGAVSYAYDCWADTAKDRLWRAEALRDPRMLAMVMCGQDRDKAKQALTCENVYYTNRFRHQRYQQMALTNRHLQYIMQGKTMKPKIVRLFVDQIRDDVAFYMQSVGPNEPEAVMAYAVVDLVESWCVYEYAKVNCLNGHRESEALHLKMLVFLQLLSECMNNASFRSLGLDGLFATSNALVHSTLNVKVNADYARRCREQANGKDGLLLKYGLLSDGSIPILPNRRVKRSKTAASHTWLLTGGILDLMNPMPPCIPRTHEGLHPGVEVNDDGLMLQNPRSGMPCNRPVQKHLRYLQCMYYAKRNWKKLNRQVLESSKQGQASSSSSSCTTAALKLDNNYFDFTRRDRKPRGGLLGKAESYILMDLFLMHAPAGWMGDEAHGHAPEGAAIKVAEFADIGMAQLFMDALLSNSAYGPSAIVMGPFPPSMKKALEARVGETAAAKTTLGVGGFLSQVVCLSLNHFPFYWEPTGGSGGGGGDLHKGNRALFVVHVPHQIQNVCFRIADLKSKLEALGCRDGFAKLCPPKSFLPLVAYLEKYANRRSNVLPHDSYITFRVDLQSTVSKTYVMVDMVRIMAIADDLNVPDATGIRVQVANRKDMPLDQHLRQFERAILQTQGKGDDLHRLLREMRNELAH